MLKADFAFVGNIDVEKPTAFSSHPLCVTFQNDSFGKSIAVQELSTKHKHEETYYGLYFFIGFMHAMTLSSILYAIHFPLSLNYSEACISNV